MSDPVATPNERLPSPWFLRDTGFRERISDADRRAFMQVCPERPYSRGSTIVRAGDPADSLHVVARGQVKLVVYDAEGEERILALCGPDDFFGEAFLFDASHYRVDAVALTDVATCPMTRDDLMRIGLRAPGFVVGFMRIMATQVQACRGRLATVHAPVRERVAEVLADQARRYGATDNEDGWMRVDMPLAHDEIAALTGATRVSVTTAIGELRRHGVVEGTRGRYRVFLPALGSIGDIGEDEA